MSIEGLAARIDALITDTRFSGVIRVDRAGETVLERSAGWAHRAHEIAMMVDTRLAIASGSKWFTALVVLSLAADGTLTLTTRARELLGDDLPRGSGAPGRGLSRWPYAGTSARLFENRLDA